MKKRTVIRVGDCYEIPLPDGRLVCCQLVNRNAQLGFLIQVFDLFLTEPLQDPERLKSTGELFPPVFIGLLPAVRSGRWRYVGNLPVTNFTFPKFRSTMATKPGTYDDWRIWDGKETIRIGKLPPKYRSLQLKSVWGAEGLEERIIDGTYRGDQMF